MTRRQTLGLDWQRGNIRHLRARYEQACRLELKATDEWRYLDTGGRRLRLLIHNAKSPSDRALVYFHGGGWIAGSPSTHADVSGALAAATGLPIVSVDYRLAPEFAAPDAIADGLAVLRSLLHARPHQYKSAILCGDSAGGSLALAIERGAEDLKVKILGAASFYGCFGLIIPPAHHPNSGNGLDARSLRRYWLAANRSSGPSPYSIEALAEGDGCPVHLVIAGRDPLRDGSIVLARRLRERGRRVSVDLQPFADHSFLQDPHAHQAKQAAYRGLTDWIGTLA